MKQFHKKYQDEAKLEQLIEEAQASRTGRRCTSRMARQYRPENPDLPTLDPWRNTTKPPAEQFVFERNPFFHRVDENGLQLPYIDQFVLNVSSSSIIPAKTGAGESDLQVDRHRLRRLHLPEGRREALSDQGQPVEAHAGRAHRAAAQPQLRPTRSGGRCCRTCAFPPRAVAGDRPARDQHGRLLRARPRRAPTRSCRRARSSSRNTQNAWIAHDPDQANALLDEVGLTERDDDGIRLLPDGRRGADHRRDRPAKARSRPTCSS